MYLPRSLATAAATFALAVSLAGCGDDGSGASADDPAETSSASSDAAEGGDTAEPSTPHSHGKHSDHADDDGMPEAEADIEVESENGEVTPLGETVEVDAGEEVVLEVDSDIADEYHVHSDPEHEFAVKASDDQQFTFSIDTPGTYELESHELGVTIVKLQVS